MTNSKDGILNDVHIRSQSHGAVKYYKVEVGRGDIYRMPFHRRRCGDSG